MKRNLWMILTLFAGMALCLTFGAGSVQADESLSAMKGQTYYLACNLHADPNNNRLSSVNYQLDGGLIPWGTKIKVTDTSKKSVALEDVKRGLKYTYVFHKRTRKATSQTAHLNRILTKDLKGLRKEVAALSELDRKGIKEGRVKRGMSKKGTLIAIAYPPEFVTPNPMNDTKWNYWYNRWKRFFVNFDENGKVSSLSGYPF